MEPIRALVTIVTPSQLWYSCYSSNVPGLHIILRVELLTLFTSGLPFLLYSSFSRPSSLGNVILLFSCSVLLFSVLRLISDPKLQTPCYIPFLVIVLFMPHNRLIIFPFHSYIPSHGYIYEQVMYDRISSYIDYSAPICATSSLLRLLHLLRCTLDYHRNSVTPKFGTTRS